MLVLVFVLSNSKMEELEIYLFILLYLEIHEIRKLLKRKYFEVVVYYYKNYQLIHKPLFLNYDMAKL